MQFNIKTIIISALALSLLSSCNLWRSPKKVPPLPNIKSTVQIQTLWNTSIGKPPQDENPVLLPTHTGEEIDVVDEAGLLQGINVATGHRKWQVHLEKKITAGPSVGEGIIVVVTARGEVQAISTENHKPVWKASVNSEVLAPPVIAQGLVFIKTIDGKLYVFNAQTGIQQWFYEQEMPSIVLRSDSPPVVVGDRVLIAFADGRLSALQAQTGAIIWQQTIAYPRGTSPIQRMVDIPTKPVVYNDKIYLMTVQGHLVAVDLTRGSIVWQRDFSSNGGVFIHDQKLYVTETAGLVWALDSQTGDIFWQQNALKEHPLSLAVVANDVLCVGDNQGTVHALALDDGRLIGRLHLGKQPINPILLVDAKHFYLTTRNGYLYALAVSSPK